MNSFDAGNSDCINLYSMLYENIISEKNPFGLAKMSVFTLNQI